MLDLLRNRYIAKESKLACVDQKRLFLPVKKDKQNTKQL